MVHKIEFKQPENSFFKYVNLQENEAKDDCLNLRQNIFEFSKGINIIVGANGSGKSTLLNCVKEYMFYNPVKYRSDISEEHVRSINHLNKFKAPNLFHEDESKGSMLDGISVYADYTACVFAPFYLTSKDRGAGDEYVLSSMGGFSHQVADASCSTGQSRMLSVVRMVDSMFGKEHSPFMNFEKLKDSGYVNCGLLYEYIKAHHIPCDGSKIFTIILDEIDANLDVDSCMEVEPFLINHRPDTQIIAVLHNVGFIVRLLNQKDVDINWIEMSPGYLDKVRSFIAGNEDNYKQFK